MTAGQATNENKLNEKLMYSRCEGPAHHIAFQKYKIEFQKKQIQS